MKKLLLSAIAIIGVVGTSMALTKKLGLLYICSFTRSEPGVCNLTFILTGSQVVDYTGTGTPIFCTSDLASTDCTQPKTLLEQP